MCELDGRLKQSCGGLLQKTPGRAWSPRTGGRGKWLESKAWEVTGWDRLVWDGREGGATIF